MSGPDTTATAPAEKVPEPLPDPHPDPQIGEWIYVVFWRSWIVGNNENGSWSVDAGRVISVGPQMLCFETHSTASVGDDQYIQGSKLRIAPRNRIYRTFPDGQRIADSLPPPGTK